MVGASFRPHTHLSRFTHFLRLRTTYFLAQRSKPRLDRAYTTHQLDLASRLAVRDCRFMMDRSAIEGNPIRENHITNRFFCRRVKPQCATVLDQKGLSSCEEIPKVDRRHTCANSVRLSHSISRAPVVLRDLSCKHLGAVVTQGSDRLIGNWQYGQTTPNWSLLKRFLILEVDTSNSWAAIRAAKQSSEKHLPKANCSKG